VAPATSITAPEEHERADEAVLEDAEHVRWDLVVVARGGGARDVAAQAGHQQARDGERHRVEREHQLGLGDQQHAGGDRGADQLPDLADRPEQAVRGSEGLRGDDRRQQRAGRGPQQRAADAGGERQCDQR
jgi:hypothetical protein